MQTMAEVDSPIQLLIDQRLDIHGNVKLTRR
jgi:hypothetical protein